MDGEEKPTKTRETSKASKVLSMAEVVWKRPVGARGGFLQILGPCAGSGVAIPYKLQGASLFRVFKLWELT